MTETLLNILAEFRGGRDVPGNTVVRFLLAAFFWAQLANAAYFQSRKTLKRRDAYILVAALFGMARKLIMFAAEYGTASFPVKGTAVIAGSYWRWRELLNRRMLSKDTGIFRLICCI